jgi:RsiW-degrading membrane proteinase PrsW (M82 family)
VKRVLRRPSFWLWLVLCLVGLGLVVLTMLPQMDAFVGGAVIGLVLLTPVLVAAVFFFIWLNPIRLRPWKPALGVVVWGMTAAFGVAFLANTAFLGILAKTAGLSFSDRWGASIAAPVDEETAKLAGVVLIALTLPRAIRGPLDGFSYGALVGAGFQVIENFLYVFNTIILTGAVHSNSAAASSFFARVVFGAWWSHWAFTCASGAGFGYLFGRTDKPMGVRIGVGLAGFLTAMGMHAWFNSPLLMGGLWQIIVKGLPLLGIAIAVYWWARTDYLRRFTAAAGQEIALGVLQPGEESLLARRRRRRAERRRVPPIEARGLVTSLRRAQLDLIEEDLAGTERVPLAADRLRHDVVTLRNQLVGSLARYQAWGRSWYPLIPGGTPQPPQSWPPRPHPSPPYPPQPWQQPRHWPAGGQPAPGDEEPPTDWSGGRGTAGPPPDGGGQGGSDLPPGTPSRMNPSP